MRPTRARIHLYRLKKNMEIMKQRSGERTFLAVIKADAYGHGALKCLDYLYEQGVRHFGVATFSEALELRSAYEDIYIMVLGATDPSDYEEGARKNIRLPIFDLPSLEHYLTLEEKGPIHIKIDTGMHRVGLQPQEFIEHIEKIKSLNAEGIYTHIARADEEDTSSAYGQIARFNELLDFCDKQGLKFTFIHYANSATILNLELGRTNMVRGGIALYGLAPDGKENFGLEPVMSLYSAILSIRDIPPGEGVSYGHTFVASRPSRVGTLPLGYADGYKRQMSRKVRVYVAGTYAPQIGNITMDQIMIDLTDTKAKLYDEVELMGEHIPAEELARAAETINYEIVTTMGRRVDREYIYE
ncbi:MAG: alanine racemase [Tissierellia bacterium]|nr:alanine racemase [Tissierellia bacterium]